MKDAAAQLLEAARLIRVVMGMLRKSDHECGKCGRKTPDDPAHYRAFNMVKGMPAQLAKIAESIHPTERIFVNGPYWFAIGTKGKVPVEVLTLREGDLFRIVYEDDGFTGPFEVLATGSEGGIPYVDYRGT